MNSESFVFYESVYKQVQRLENKLGAEVAMSFLNAVMEFGLYGVMPEEEDDVWLYGFEQTITSIDRAKDRYEKSIENGKKGGRPKKFDEQQMLELKRKGMSNKDIAARMGCSVRTVERTFSDKTDKIDKTRHNLNDNDNDNVNDNIVGLVPHPIGETPNPQKPEEEKIFIF